MFFKFVRQKDNSDILEYAQIAEKCAENGKHKTINHLDPEKDENG